MSGRVPSRLRGSLGTKVILPALVLLVGFATAAVVGYTMRTTRAMESQVDAELAHDARLLQRIMEENRERIALHARFLADMIDLSNTFPEPRSSQSILIYMLEYMGQQRVTTHLRPDDETAGGRYANLVRSAHLGIRATSVLAAGGPDGARLSIAGVAPVERVNGIDEVVISELLLDEAFLKSIRPKLAAEITLFLGDDPVVTTIGEPRCAALVVAAAATAGPGLPSATECLGVPYRSVAGVIATRTGPPIRFALSESMADLRVARQQIVRNTVAGALVALSLAVVAYAWIVRRVTRPVHALSTATARVAEGDLEVELEPTTHDEVGELSENFNRMVQRLRESRERIEKLHNRELEHAERLATVGELAAGVAHEVRNPLAGISGAIELLRRDLQGIDGKGEILDEVRKQIDRMNKLTTDLLTFSQPREPSPTDYCINRSVDEALFLLATGGRESRFEFRKSYEDRLPPVRIDPQQIHQVLLNVLMNACQAMPDGGRVEIRTALAEDDTGSRVLVTIRDHGPGIPEEMVGEVVRPFVTTKPKGTGLGLAIVRRILDSHGGGLRIRNADGGGAEVVVMLPASPSWPKIRRDAS